MSRKIKSTRMKRKGNHTKKKIKGGDGDDGLSATSPDNKRREYTVILLENSDIEPENIITSEELLEIKEKIQEKIQEKMEEDHELLKKFEINGLKIIKSGLHVGEESINNSSMTSRFIRPSNASHKKYLGIILDLTHFETETSLDGSEIIKIFRDNINTPPKS